jgi:hypothetical protein
MFKVITGKMGNMKKEVEWVLYPRNADSTFVIIQSDKRIAKVELVTGKTVLSSGHGGHNGFMHLNPIMKPFIVDCPPAMLQALQEMCK